MTKITRQKAHRKEERQRDLICIAIEICKIIFLLEIRNCKELSSIEVEFLKSCQ